MNSPSARKGRGKLPVRRIWWTAAAVVAVTLAAAAWRVDLRRRERTASGGELGRLAAGVSRERLNLVVVTLDTTRADRLGAYGATQIHTPVFDRLAREGVLFEQTESVAPLTLPAH